MSSVPGAIIGVVLAAGASSRMGRCKALLELGDTTYLGTVLRTLSRVPVAAVVVVGADAEPVAREARRASRAVIVVINHGWRAGMLSSLQAGIRNLEGSDAVGLLLCPVDIPRFRRETAVALIEAQRRHAAPVVVPTYDGQHGHPVLFAREVWPDLLAAPASIGARAVVRARAQTSVAVAVDDPWIVRDADTPEQHRRLTEGV